VEDYEALNVASVLERVTEGAAGKPAASARPAGAGSPHGEPTGSYPDERLVSIETIPWNAILTRDIFTPGGQLFMKAGADLAPRVIALLTDLDRLSTPVKDIWVTVPEN
jgi:hypothetical protein